MLSIVLFISISNYLIYVLFQGGSYIFEFKRFADRDACQEIVGESQLLVVFRHVKFAYILRLSGKMVIG